jgi:hypothetical protein
MTSSLVKLRNDVQNLNPDRANFIRGYWKQTGVKISLIFSLIDIDQHLIDNRNPDLNRKFKVVQGHLVDHISKKIDSGTSDADDLLFELKEVAALELEQAVPNLIKDVKQLEKDQSKQERIIQLLEGKQFSELLNSL